MYDGERRGTGSLGRRGIGSKREGRSARPLREMGGLWGRDGSEQITLLPAKERRRCREGGVNRV